MEASQELDEVRAALRDGGVYLGLKGPRLQRYALEVAKKEHLLRLALSAPRRRGSASVPPSWAQPLEASELVRERRRRAAAPAVLPMAVSAPTPSLPSTAVPQPAEDARALPSTAMPQDGGPSRAPQEEAAQLAAAAEDRSAAKAEEDRAYGLLRDADGRTLAEALRLMQAYPGSERVQRAGLHALSHLARDTMQLRSQCLAAVAAAVGAAATFRGSCPLQRLAMSALGGVAYVPMVAALIRDEALPAVFQAMFAHPGDAKLQSLCCEALARLSMPDAAQDVVEAAARAMLWHPDAAAVEASVVALARLVESGICQEGPVLKALVRLSEAHPEDLEAQRRAAEALQGLVGAGAVEAAAAAAVAEPLLSPRWAQLLGRFLGAETDEAELKDAFHAEVQALFHEEVVRHFEYEAAERSAQLLAQGAPPPLRLREVLRCLVENLEDYRGRLEVRELAWDAASGRLVALDDALRSRLLEEASSAMEAGLASSLAAAAASTAEGAALLQRRTAWLRSECGSLLERKTELTQAHEERAAEFRREVMLFEAVEFLELRASRGQATWTQTRSALRMLQVAAPAAPADAVERLRHRLTALAAQVAVDVPLLPGRPPKGVEPQCDTRADASARDAL